MIPHMYAYEKLPEPVKEYDRKAVHAVLAAQAKLKENEVPMSEIEAPLSNKDQWFEASYRELLALVVDKVYESPPFDEALLYLVNIAFLGAKLDKIERRLGAMQNQD